MTTIHACPCCHKILAREDRFGKRRGVFIPICGTTIKIGEETRIKCSGCNKTITYNESLKENSAKIVNGIGN